MSAAHSALSRFYLPRLSKWDRDRVASILSRNAATTNHDTNLAERATRGLALRHAALDDNEDIILRLELRATDMTDEDCFALAKGLATNASLTYLDLRHNGRVTAAGITAIAEALRSHPSLEALLIWPLAPPPPRELTDEEDAGPTVDAEDLLPAYDDLTEAALDAVSSGPRRRRSGQATSPHEALAVKKTTSHLDWTDPRSWSVPQGLLLTANASSVDNDMKGFSCADHPAVRCWGALTAIAQHSSSLVALGLPTWPASMPAFLESPEWKIAPRRFSSYEDIQATAMKLYTAYIDKIAHLQNVARVALRSNFFGMPPMWKRSLLFMAMGPSANADDKVSSSFAQLIRSKSSLAPPLVLTAAGGGGGHHQHRSSVEQDVPMTSEFVDRWVTFDGISTLLGLSSKLNTTVTRLHLCGLGRSAFGDTGATRFSAAILADGSQHVLQEIALRENGIATAGSTAICEALLAATRGARAGDGGAARLTLHDLDLSNNDIPDAGAQVWLDAFAVPHRTSLLALTLDGNPTQPALLSRLLQLMLINTQPKGFRDVILQAQKNSSAASRIVFNGTGLSTEKSLIVAHNSGGGGRRGGPDSKAVAASAAECLNDVSCRALLQAVRHNTVVTHIDLSNNAITDEGAVHLAEVIADCLPTLKRVNLSLNHITTIGATLLYSAMCANKSMESLDVRHQSTDIDADLLQRIEWVSAARLQPVPLNDVCISALNHDASTTRIVIDTRFDGRKYLSDATIVLLRDILAVNTLVDTLVLRKLRTYGEHEPLADTISTAMMLATSQDSATSLSTSTQEVSNAAPQPRARTGLATEDTLCALTLSTADRTKLHFHIVLPMIVLDVAPRLVHLDLSDNGLRGEVYGDLLCDLLLGDRSRTTPSAVAAAHFAGRHSLKEVILDGNDFSPANVDDWITILQRANHTIQLLSVERNPRLGTVVPVVSSKKATTAATSAARSFQQPDVSNASVADGPLTIIGDDTPAGRLLRVCVLNRYDPSFKHLITSVTHNDAAVVAVNLVEIEKTLEGSTSHRFAKKYTDEAVTILCHAMARNTTVQSVNLSGHKITDVGATELASLIAGSVSLTSVNIDANELSEVGLAALTKAVAANPRMLVLTAGGNRKVRDHAALKQLTAAVALNVRRLTGADAAQNGEEDPTLKGASASLYSAVLCRKRAQLLRAAEDDMLVERAIAQDALAGYRPTNTTIAVVKAAKR